MPGRGLGERLCGDDAAVPGMGKCGAAPPGRGEACGTAPGRRETCAAVVGNREELVQQHQEKKLVQ